MTRSVGITTMVIGVMLTGLFALALIYGDVQLAQNSNAPQSIADNPVINNFTSSITTTLSTAQSKSNNTFNAIDQSEVTLSSNGIFLNSIGGIWKNFVIYPFSLMNAFFNLIMQFTIFGAFQNLFLSVIASLVVIVIVTGIIRFVSGRDND